MNVDGAKGADGAQNNEQMASEQIDATIPKCAAIPPLPRAAELLFANSIEEKKLYWDRSHYESPEAQMRALGKSSTLYIGNLAFSTRSTQIRSHFSMIGPVKAVHLGLDRFRKTPCGFCFVEYHERRDALEAVANLSGSKLDGRVIRVELDAGFQAGRQYGRGAMGGQVRDDRRRGGMDPARQRRDEGATARPEGAGDAAFNNAAAGEKHEREDADMEGDRPDKNPRFRED